VVLATSQDGARKRKGARPCGSTSRSPAADAWWFADAVVVEHRYIGPIIGGAIGDGLVVR